MESNAQRAAAEAWPWPDSLDALTAAPQYHTVLLENDRVRVVHTHIPPGDLVPVHTHRSQGVVYVQSWSDFIRRDQHGNVLLDSRMINPRPKAPAVQWLEPLPPHTVENIGDAEISLYIVELKGTAPAKVGRSTTPSPPVQTDNAAPCAAPRSTSEL